ncbi:ABC-three component system protein [Methylobacterium indicum]|uniref:ABC-three component system protein n=1 Tax=Methylobacterium indicum TaxID=1775910 RepID=UPI0009E22315|nr:ABC-three component system protein [Methylobacterium indicum]
MSAGSSQFSAAEQGLGYIYQSRFALLKAIDLPEDCFIYIERNDDVEFVPIDGKVSLASLKHKDADDRLTDLSIDFWKSVRVWLKYYNENGKVSSDARFLLYSTSSISKDSFLLKFTENAGTVSDKAKKAEEAIKKSKSKFIKKIKVELDKLEEAEKSDFYERITIFSEIVRIQDIPELIDRRLRTIRKEFRKALFESLEGWWNDVVIDVLTGVRSDPIRVQEVSEKLALLAEEYRSDNLPINFRNKSPSKFNDNAEESRTFVMQLNALNLPQERIQLAILDYYRAFEQRSSWSRENLLILGEIEGYEDRLIEEWKRYRALVCENINEGSGEDACINAGRELYKWAEFSTTHLRIRERVTEPYVVRGAFHILANDRPSPRVYWHPTFLKKLSEVLGVAA